MATLADFSGINTTNVMTAIKGLMTTLISAGNGKCYTTDYKISGKTFRIRVIFSGGQFNIEMYFKGNY